MFLIEKYGLRLLLQLPENLRQKLFANKKLDQDTKFVLATLYLLDSKNSIKDYRTELPRHTGLDWSRCEECLSELVHLNLIEYTRSVVHLRIKPLTYNNHYAKKK